MGVAPAGVFCALESMLYSPCNIKKETHLVIRRTLPRQERRRTPIVPQPIVEASLDLVVGVKSKWTLLRLLLNAPENLEMIVDLNLDNCCDVGPVVCRIGPKSKEQVWKTSNSNAFS